MLVVAGARVGSGGRWLVLKRAIKEISCAPFSLERTYTAMAKG